MSRDLVVAFRGLLVLLIPLSPLLFGQSGVTVLVLSTQYSVTTQLRA